MYRFKMTSHKYAQAFTHSNLIQIVSRVGQETDRSLNQLQILKANKVSLSWHSWKMKQTKITRIQYFNTASIVFSAIKSWIRTYSVVTNKYSKEMQNEGYRANT